MTEYMPSVVFVATSSGEARRVEQLNSANTRALNAAEDTIFALTPSGVYDVFTLTMALESESLGISSGEAHNVLLAKDGKVYSWGAGTMGELGLGPRRTQVDAPELVRLPEPLTSVACGRGYSCGVDTRGNVYAWGQNFSHQLGLYTKPLGQMKPGCLVEDIVMTPRILPFSVKKSVLKVACGTDFTFAITKSKQLWSWGAGESGQLGSGRCKTKEVPSQFSVHDTNGNEVAIVDVSCGFAHTLALSDVGEVYVWGLNKHGQLGTGNRNQLYKPTPLGKEFTAKSVVASHNSSAVVTPSGQLFTWGAGSNYRLMQGHDGTIDRPTVVKAMGNEVVNSFVFSTTSSAALVLSQLTEVAPQIGTVKSFGRMEISGYGLWSSDTIIVRFTRCPEEAAPGAEVEDVIFPPRSTMGKLTSPNTITCKPPRFAIYGYYDVMVSLDGKSFLGQSSRVYICSEPSIISIQKTLYDMRETTSIDIEMECTGLGDKGSENVDLFVQFVNCTDKTITSGPIKAELVPVISGAADDTVSLGEASVSETGSQVDEGAQEEERPEATSRSVICRDIMPASFRSGDAGTVMIQAQLSRNGIDFTPLSQIQLICHEFTTVDLFPNFVPLGGAKEIIVRGSGFFPADIIATVALVTPINPVVGEAATSASRKNSSASVSHSIAGSVKAPVVVTTDEDDGDDHESIGNAEDGNADAHNPLLNVITMRADVLSSTEMKLLVPPINDFLKDGYAFPEDLPYIVDAQVSFSLANDPANFLSKVGLDLKYFKNGKMSLAPTALRRPTCDKSVVSFIDSEINTDSTITPLVLLPEHGWLRSVSNAAKVIIRNSDSGFLRTPSVDFVSVEETGAYSVKCDLDISTPPISPGEEESPDSGESSSAEPPSNVPVDMNEIDSLSIELLLDGSTPLDEVFACKLPLFNNVKVVGPVQPFPKDGAPKGSTVTMSVQGIVNTASNIAKIRLRGTNDKYEEVQATIVGEITSDGSANISFNMPESLGEVAVNVKGKEKSVFVDISIDGLSYDKGGAPILLVKY